MHTGYHAKSVLILVRLSRERWRPWAAALFSQVLRSSLSVQLNIAEGYAFGHVPARVRHYRVAYGSAAETSEICDLLIEAGIVNEEETRGVADALTPESRVVLGTDSIRTGKEKNRRGSLDTKTGAAELGGLPSPSPSPVSVSVSRLPSPVSRLPSPVSRLRSSAPGAGWRRAPGRLAPGRTGPGRRDAVPTRCAPLEHERAGCPAPVRPLPATC